MSEHLPVGESDASARWLGVRSQQLVLLVLGLTLAGDWLVRAAPVVELALGVGLAASAAPARDGLSVGEVVAVAVRYASRGRWSVVGVDLVGDQVAVHGRGDVMVRGFELRHRGRLDLSGADARIANSLADLVDSLATSDATEHASVHVRSTSAEAVTLLTLGGARLAPEEWSPRNELVARVVGVELSEPTWVLERWGYVRTPSEVVSVLRIGDFSAAPPGRALLERLQVRSGPFTVALHYDVVSGARARRSTERAVHRHRSNGAVERAAGFRRSARAERSFQRLAQREGQVASGRALVRLAVYVAVRASTNDELRREVAAVVRATHDAGLRCERGGGRQALWFHYQLPGGLGW